MASISVDHYQLDLGMLDDDMEISSDRGQDIGEYNELDRDPGHDEDADFIIDDDQTAEAIQESNEYADDDLMSDDNPSMPALEDVITMDSDINFEDEELDDASIFDTDNLDITDAYHPGLGTSAPDLVTFSNSRDITPLPTANVENPHSGLDFEEEAGDAEQPERQSAVPSTERKSVRSSDSYLRLARNVDSGEVESYSSLASSDSLQKGREEPTALLNDVFDNEKPTLASGSQVSEKRNTADANAAENVFSTERAEDLPERTHVEEHADDNYANAGSDSESLVHPVAVIWKDNLCHLFKPSDSHSSEMYFLSDATLCHRPLLELLRGCRTSLGSNISEDMQLVAYFQKLGLTVSEDMADPPNTSLGTLLEVYVLLTQQSDECSQRPLYIELRTEFRFSFRLMALHNAREQGKSLNDIEAVEATDYDASAEFEDEAAFADVEEPEENFYEEEYDENDEQETQQYEAPFENVAYDGRPQTAEGELTNEAEGSALPDEDHDAEVGNVDEAIEADAENAAVPDEEGITPGPTVETATVNSDTHPQVDPEINEVHLKLASSSTDVIAQSLEDNLAENEPKADFHALEDHAEDDLDDFDGAAAEGLGEQDHSTNYPDDVLDDLDAPSAHGTNENSSSSENVTLYLDYRGEQPTSEEDNDINLGMDHNVEELIPAQETGARTELPTLAQHDNFDEDELTFSEDDLDDVQDRHNLPNDSTKAKISTSHPEDSPRSTTDSTTNFPSPSLPTSRKRSFGEHTDLNLDDGGEQKKPRPA